MEITTFVIMIILSVTLFIFLIVGTVAMIKLIQILNRVKRVSDAGARIVDTSAKIVDDVKTGVSSVVGQAVGSFASSYMNNREAKQAETKKKGAK